MSSCLVKVCRTPPLDISFLNSNFGLEFGKTASEIQVMSQPASGAEAVSQLQCTDGFQN
jgi:hypothetical protein